MALEAASGAFYVLQFRIYVCRGEMTMERDERSREMKQARIRQECGAELCH